VAPEDSASLRAGEEGTGDGQVSDESEMDRVFDEFVEELISDMKETQQRWLELCQAVE
jgi:hypothetical protein